MARAIIELDKFLSRVNKKAQNKKQGKRRSGVRPVLQAFFFERKRRGIMAKKILAAANNKEQKYFMEEEFKFLPVRLRGFEAHLRLYGRKAELHFSGRL